MCNVAMLLYFDARESFFVSFDSQKMTLLVSEGITKFFLTKFQCFAKIRVSSGFRDFRCFRVSYLAVVYFVADRKPKIRYQFFH